MKWTLGGILLIAIIATGCADRVPTSPTTIDLTGTWEAQLLLTRCSANANDLRPCAIRGPNTKRLILTQIDRSVFGRYVHVFTLNGVLQLAEERAIPVFGEVSGQTVTLSGRIETPLDQEILENWLTSVPFGLTSGLRMEGTFDHRHIQASYCPGDYFCTDPIVWRRSYHVELTRVDPR